MMPLAPAPATKMLSDWPGVTATRAVTVAPSAPGLVGVPPVKALPPWPPEAVMVTKQIPAGTANVAAPGVVNGWLTGAAFNEEPRP